MLPKKFFSILSSISSHHSSKSANYKLIKELCLKLFENSDFKSKENKEILFAEFGEIIFPFYSFGKITTIDLFGIDELIIFAFYLANKNKYKNVLDIGGNLGLHSILMSILNWQVRVYEPDPLHLDILKKNIFLNKCSKNIEVFPKAVLNKKDKLEFTRVLGNTTGSHLSGMKTNPYGKLDKFVVETSDIKDIIQGIDFIKLDAEGAEVDIITSISRENLTKTDIMLEVSSEKNANIIFEYINDYEDINMFSQLNNWEHVTSISHMPSSHREGSLFISSNLKMNFVYE